MKNYRVRAKFGFELEIKVPATIEQHVTAMIDTGNPLELLHEARLLSETLEILEVTSCEPLKEKPCKESSCPE